MIQPSPTAPEGSVTRGTAYAPADFPADAAILCRLTAPLISFAFSLLQRSIPCRVLGREIGTGLIKLIDAQKTQDLEELESKLIVARGRDISKAHAHNASKSAIAAIEDKYDCLNVFLQNAESVASLKSKILDLFDETRTSVITLSTIHKAKGLEWPKVFILDPALMPSPWAEQPWQKVQERNLQYVAVTRAKLDLVYINSNCWKT